MLRLLCVNVYFMILTKLLFSSGEVFSEQASRYQTSVVSLEAQNIIEVPVEGLSSACCVTLCECVFHEFHHKLPFSSGEVFSEQACRYQTSMMSLEAQNILEVLFQGLSSTCGVYFV